MEAHLEESVHIVLRPFIKHLDQPCIYATWRNSSYYGSLKELGDPKPYFKAKTLEIKDILDHAVIKIACLSDDPMFIVGYSVATDGHLHFIYVKADYRQKGIGSLLIPKNITSTTSQLTKIGQVLAEKKNLLPKGETDGH